MDDKLVEFEANFSVLDRYGVDVTAETFITNPAIGRDNQLKELMLILLTPEKSAILIGKPGIGKTAIVEGLAYKMQKGEVPDALQGYTIINIKTASLLGTMPSGESKVQKMIDELKLREKIILFVDEIHMLIGATDSSSLDFANIFKEGLGRGSIKVIGATTTEEYERYILRDKAFTRRFQKVEVPEPTHDETVQIMMGTLPKFEKQTGRKMKYTSFIQQKIMNFLVEITSEYKRIFALGSRYPDVCLTLLKQAFSYTVFDNREEMNIFDVRKAIENSKNIYPDVIKKELPRFDKEFNDIILEERGLITTETNRDIERKNSNVESEIKMPNIFMDSPDQDSRRSTKKRNTLDFSYLESKPVVVDRKRKQEYQPVKNIMNPKKNNRNGSVLYNNFNEDLSGFVNNKDNRQKIDDLILSNGIKVISDDKNEVPSIPFQYKITNELKPNGLNDLLLGGEIGSTLDENPQKVLDIETYKSDSLFEREKERNKNLILSDNSNNRNNNNNNRKRNRDNSSRNVNNSRNSSDRTYERNGDFMSNNVDDFLLRGRDSGFNNTKNSVNFEKTMPNDTNNKNKFNNSNFNSLGGINIFDDVSDLTSNNNKNVDNNRDDNSFFNKSDGFSKKDETLFGAPMYSDNEEKKVVNETDIFGQLLVSDNDMIIRDGQIVNNFAGLNVNDDDNNDNNASSDGLILSDNYYSQDMNTQNSSNEKSKNWKFLPEFESENKQSNKFNELNLNKVNKQYVDVENDSMSSNNNEMSYINFSDLNAGKVSNADVNKSISFSNNNSNSKDNESIKNNFDLNLENGNKEERYFDDFFDD